MARLKSALIYIYIYIYARKVNELTLSLPPLTSTSTCKTMPENAADFTLTGMFLFQRRKGLCHFGFTLSTACTFVLLRGKLMWSESPACSIAEFDKQRMQQPTICKTYHGFSLSCLWDIVTTTIKETRLDWCCDFFSRKHRQERRTGALWTLLGGNRGCGSAVSMQRTLRCPQQGSCYWSPPLTRVLP